MPSLDFKNWPAEQQEDRKPFDRLMPFHRLRVPANQFVKNRSLFQPRIISGDGFSVGARSTKDYDGKFGEDLAKDLAELMQTVFPILQAGKVVTQALALFFRGIPGLGPLAQKLDVLDPFAELFKFFGNRLDALLTDSFIRSIPAWVPTFDERLHPNIQILELDGIVIRSHQRYDSVPFWQWHRWYDWRFNVIPSPLFNEMVGFGNAHRDDDNEKLNETRKTEHGEEGDRFIPYYREGLPVNVSVPKETGIDCEWDIGALGDKPGPFFLHPDSRGRLDWCWPMTGMFFWAIGRSVYDCSHATADNGRRTKKTDRKHAGFQLPEDERLKRGVHMNQLHPLKAIATARWEAFQFKENPKPVPAIQFMFFTNNQLSSAGFFDKNLPSKSPFVINDQNYEFVVDLPPLDVTKKPEYTVGHTPDFALNTLVLRPRLVVDFNFDPFQNAGGIVEDHVDREKTEITRATKETGPLPIVQLRLPKNEPPRQALVTIPLKNMSANINSYGVIISIGFLDPDATQAKKVKKVTVRLVSIQPSNDLHESGDAEWNLNVGINGRWFQFRFVVKNLDRIENIEIAKIAGAPVEVEMLLSEDDFVMLSVHGMEEDPFDDLFRKPPEFPAPQERPPKDPSSVTVQNLSKEVKAALMKLGLNDRLLRHAGDVKVPTGPPDLSKGDIVPSETFKVPLIGQEVNWDQDIDTDDNHQASLVARAMFLRLAMGNHFDANDLLGMIDPNMPDPARKDPKTVKRSQDKDDTPNPLIVGDIVQEVGLGVFKKCQLTAYATQVVGRMGTIAYEPDVLDYTFHYEVKVENLPEEK